MYPDYLMENKRSPDPAFLKKAVMAVAANLDKEHFSGNELAELLCLSREQTHRKIKQLTSLSTGRFIRNIRMLKAYKLLLENNSSIAEVSYQVGFGDPSYFNKCFREELGISPGEIKKTGSTHPLAGGNLYAFFSLPEINEVLRHQKITFEIDAGPAPVSKKKNIWLAGVPLLLIVVLIVIGYYKTKPPGKIRAVINNRVVVLPFNNQTGDTLMSAIGDIASSWISNQLAQLKDIQTVPYFTVKQYQSYIGVLPGDPQNRPTLSELVAAAYYITGDYYLRNNEVYFNVRFVDAKSLEPVYNLPVMNGSKDSIMSLVEDIRLKIAGLLSNLESVKQGKLKPPNYEAYLAYLEGLKELNTGLYENEAVHYFETAAILEPEFVMPQVFLTWFYTGNKRDSLLRHISTIKGITDYEKKVFTIWNLVFKRDYNAAFDLGIQVVNDYPQDYYFNMMVGYLAKSRFQPELAIKALSQLQDPLKSDFGMVWHYFKVFNYFESLMMLHQFDTALNYLRTIPVDRYNLEIPKFFIYDFIKLGKTANDIEVFIAETGRNKMKMLAQKFKLDEQKLYALYFTTAAYEFYLVSKPNETKYFAGKAMELFNRIPGKEAYKTDVYDALFLSGDLRLLKEQLNQALRFNPANEDLRVYLAMAEAALGREEAALKIIAGLGKADLVTFRRHEFPYQKDYIIARVYALSGNKPKALEYLQSALKKGQLSHYYDFGRDVFLRSLFDEPAFRQLTRPAESSKSL